MYLLIMKDTDVGYTCGVVWHSVGVYCFEIIRSTIHDGTEIRIRRLHYHFSMGMIFNG
jgi:hypothetical protein